VSDLTLVGYAQLPGASYDVADLEQGTTVTKRPVQDLPVYFSASTNTPVYFDGTGYYATPLEHLPKSVQHKWRKLYEAQHA